MAYKVFNFVILNYNQDFIIYYILLFYLIYIITNYTYTYLQLLTNFEIIWIIFYILCILISFLYDNIMLIGIIFFLLIFSAIDLSIGFILVTLQFYLYNNIIFKNNIYNSKYKIKKYYNWYNIS